MRQEKAYKNILVISLVNLGDLISATATASLVKKYYPGAQLTFMVRQPLAAVLDNHPDIDRVLPFSYKSGGDYLSPFRLARALRAGRFDLSIALCNRTRSDLAVWLAGIPVRVGPGNVWGRKKFSEGLYTDNPLFPCPPETPHYISLQKIFCHFIGQPENTNYLKPVLPAPGEAHMRKAALLIGGQEDSRLKLALCVKAEASEKNWETGAFAQTIKALCAQYPVNPYIVGGLGDREYASAISKEAACPVKNLCGQTSLPELAAVLKSSDLLISVDNGTAHMASALNVPTICLFTATPPLLNPPLSDLACSLYGPDAAAYKALPPGGKVNITPQEAIAAAGEIIARLPGRTSR